MSRELHLPEEPAVGARVSIVQGHISSTFSDGVPWTRTSGGDGYEGGTWWRRPDRDSEIEQMSWRGLIRRWLDVHPYERARLVVVAEGEGEAVCPQCGDPMSHHSPDRSRRCLTQLAEAARRVS